MATTPDLNNDDDLAAVLTDALLAADPVPGHVTDAAKAAFSWMTLDADLAALTFDSTTELAGVRSTLTDRQLTFATDSVEVELVIADDPSGATIEGQVVPMAEVTVTLLTPTDEPVTVQADEMGRFRFVGVSTGLVRLQVQSQNDQRLSTESFTV